MKVGVNEQFYKIHDTSSSIRYRIVTQQSASVCILMIVVGILEKNSLVQWEETWDMKNYGIHSKFVGQE